MKAPIMSGLSFRAKSPRHVDVEEARVLAAVARGKIGTVAVLVDPDDALIEGVAERVRPDLLQLHGSETPERVTAIKTRTGLPVMKAIPVAEASDVVQAQAYAGNRRLHTVRCESRRRARAVPAASA